jgi:hypothetical protein
MTTDTTDTRWLTYDELAAALGITPDSARRLVARKKWPRRAGNDGRARIGVPAERIPDKPPVSHADTIPDVEEDDSPDDRSDVTLIVSILTQHIERIEKELETVKSERDAERLQAAQLALKAAEVDALKAVIESERKRTEDMKAEQERLRSDRDRWADQAEKLAAARSWWSKILLRA